MDSSDSLSSTDAELSSSSDTDIDDTRTLTSANRRPPPTSPPKSSKNTAAASSSFHSPLPSSSSSQRRPILPANQNNSSPPNTSPAHIRKKSNLKTSPVPIPTPIRSVSTRTLETELFDWSAPLAQIPYYENAEQQVHNLYENPRQLERLVWIGLSCCTDTLLDSFAFLPFKILFALVTAVKGAIQRACCRCRRNPLKIPPDTPLLHSKHIHSLLQGCIIVVTLLSVNILIDLFHLNFYSAISKATWVKLYVLFNLFAVFDLMLERVGKRLTGFLNWCVVVGGSSTWLYIVIASSIYVLIHSLVLICQISTIHSAIDNGAEVLGVLVNVKLSDLKEGFRTSHDSESLFKLTLQDVAQRFKWIIFLIMITAQKLLRLSSMPSIQDLINIKLQWNTIVYWASWFSRGIFSGSFFLSCIDPQQWNQVLSQFNSSLRATASSWLLGFFSPELETALRSSDVYVTPVAANAAAQSGVSLFASKPPPHFPNATDPTILIIDALTVLPMWLPTFLYSAVVTLLIVSAIDWLKHATLSLFNPDWLVPRVYRSFQNRLSSFFLQAPKLGLGDQKLSSFAMSHFDFMSLPLVVVILREVWSCTVAIVNSCVWGNWWLQVLGRNVILSQDIRNRCAIYFHQSNRADALFASGKPLPPVGTAASLDDLNPMLRAMWIEDDPQQHFFLAALLLFGLRVAMFVAVVIAKVIIRLALRRYAKRNHRLTQEAAQLQQQILAEKQKPAAAAAAAPASVAKSSTTPIAKSKAGVTLSHITTSANSTPASTSTFPLSDSSDSSTDEEESEEPSELNMGMRARKKRVSELAAQAVQRTIAASEEGSDEAPFATPPPLDRRKSMSLITILKGAMRRD